MKTPIIQKIPHKVIFGHVPEENRGSNNLMDPPITIMDNYYWIRDDTKKSNLILERIKEENDYFQHKFKNKEKFSKNLYAEILMSMKEDYDTYPETLYSSSKWKYFSRYNTGSDYVQHWRTNQADGEERIDELLLDENTMVIPEKELDITEFNLNPTEKYISYGIDYESNELYELQIVNIETKELVYSIKDLIYCSYQWTSPDTIYYLRGDGSNRLYQLYKLNIENKEETLVYQEIEPEYDLSIEITSDDKYLIVKSGNYSENKILFINLLNQESNIQVLLNIEPNILYNVDHSDNYFYVYTNADLCTNWKICKINDNFDSIDKILLEPFIPYNPNIYIETFYCNAKYLIYVTKINGTTFINCVDYQLDKIKIIDQINTNILKFSDYIKQDFSYYKIDQVCTLGLASNFIFNSDKLYVTQNTMINPYRIFCYDLDTMGYELVWEKEVPYYKPEEYQSERIWIKISEESNGNSWPLGIPVSIVYKKDMWIKDGTKPLYLYGYGSYGYTIEPNFDFKILPLLERGWAFAIAHVRGGSFVNYAWYEDGRLENKLNSFNDFITVAEYLKSNKYCSDITIEGRSAGGLLVGTCMVMRPDLFKNVIAGVPFLDVMNTMCDSTIPLTIEEWSQWGNPNIKSDFDYMIKYCPYSNIKSTDYPNMFITCGLWDPRVQYWEPHKFIAKLREYKTDDNVQIIKTTVNQGHFGGSSRYKYLEEVAEKYAFILDEYQ